MLEENNKILNDEQLGKVAGGAADPEKFEEVTKRLNGCKMMLNSLLQVTSETINYPIHSLLSMVSAAAATYNNETRINYINMALGQMDKAKALFAARTPESLTLNSVEIQLKVSLEMMNEIVS